MKAFLVKGGAVAALVCFLIALLRRPADSANVWMYLGIVLLVLSFLSAFRSGGDDDSK